MAMQNSKLHLYVFAFVGVLVLIGALIVAGLWWTLA